MTTPAEFEEAVLSSMNYLDTILPNGSHVVFIGLADGRLLWDTLWNRTHPLGVTYESMYNYLNCLGINPCWVWMNSNETVRNLGAVRAAELDAVYGQIIANYTFENFDMIYFPFPFPEIAKIWKQMGGQQWQLIEPVDGFHPSQISNWISGSYLFDQILQNYPEFVGQVNPYNAIIQQLFGDQGGY